MRDLQNDASGQPDDTRPEAGSRRSFLTKAAAGTAVVWAAPVVLSRPALAAGSAGPCTTRTLSWAPFAGSVPSGFSTAVGPTTFGLSYADATSAVLTSTVDGVFPRAGQPVSYHMQLNGSGAGPVVITLTFAPAVTALSFRLLDVDWAGTTGWQDRVTVGNAVATPLNPARFVENPGPSATWTGNAATGNSDNLSDIAVAATGPVSSVTVTYARARTVSSQGIGISDINWCA